MNCSIAPQRILITGIAGNIGRCIAPALAARGHLVTGLDNRPLDPFPTTLGSITDPDLVALAMRDIDTVIHLAAKPHDADFITHLLQPNVVGMVNICQRAADAKIARLILASTTQVHFGHRELQAQRPLTVADGPAPTNFYALTKVWAEETGRMFARTHPDMSVLCARIGAFATVDPPTPTMLSPRSVHLYLSRPDAARFFIAAVESPPLPPTSSGRFAIAFCFSKPALATVDLQDTHRLIGYTPQDDFPTAP